MELVGNREAGNGLPFVHKSIDSHFVISLVLSFACESRVALAGSCFALPFHLCAIALRNKLTI